MQLAFPGTRPTNSTLFEILHMNLLSALNIAYKMLEIALLNELCLLGKILRIQEKLRNYISPMQRNLKVDTIIPSFQFTKIDPTN